MSIIASIYNSSGFSQAAQKGIMTKAMEKTNRKDNRGQRKDGKNN
jgi:hypothetical protein